MTKWKMCLGTLALAVSMTAVSGSAMAQATGQPAQPGQPGAQQPGQGRQRGNFDPAAARQRTYDRLKADLGASDDEWKALQPKVEKLMNAQRDARGGGGRGGPGGGGGRNRGGNNAPADATAAAAQPTAELSAVAKASAELKAAIDDKTTAAPVLAQKLAALREAKDKAKGELASAQKELRELLTQRQEAILVNTGRLD